MGSSTHRIISITPNGNDPISLFVFYAFPYPEMHSTKIRPGNLMTKKPLATSL